MDMKEVDQVPYLSSRPAESHKGDFGRTFILAGSRGMTGAASLTARGALLGGSGLITVGIPESLNHILEVKITCPMTVALAEEEGALSIEGWPEIEDYLEKSDALAVGPGISQKSGTKKLVERLLAKVEIPFVLDADGLNNLAGKTEILKDCQAPGIITPHPGEFCRISGMDKNTVIEEPRKSAGVFARKMEKVVLLKGHGTVVTDGRKWYQNTTGNPGMASGGSGDVLTGLIGAFLGQGLSPFESGVLGAYIHGKAGDLAAEEKGQISMTALDILAFLPRALKDHHGF